MQYDFRDIYASILKDWFGVPAAEVQTLFEHTITFHNLMGACNVGLEEEELGKEKALIYPNPAYTNATVRFNCENEWVKIDIYDMNKRHVMSVFDGQLSQGQHDVFMETRDLSMGQYFTQVKKESGTIITTLVKAS